jgi:hypothetical protein
MISEGAASRKLATRGGNSTYSQLLAVAVLLLQTMVSDNAAIVGIPEGSAIAVRHDPDPGRPPFNAPAPDRPGSAINQAQAVTPVQAEAKARSSALNAISTIAAFAAFSPRDFVLYGDSGLLIQSNNAAATIGRLALQPVYTTPVRPAVPPVEPTSTIVQPRRRDGSP